MENQLVYFLFLFFTLPLTNKKKTKIKNGIVYIVLLSEGREDK